MEINDYQTQIRNYVDYPTDIGPFTTILDLSLNVGKLSDKLNKVLVNNHGSFSKENGTILSSPFSSSILL